MFYLDAEPAEGEALTEPMTTTAKYDDPYAETPTRLRSFSAVEPSRNDVEPTVLSSSFTDSVAIDEKPCSGLNGKDSPPSGHDLESSSSTVPEINGDGSNIDSSSSTVEDTVDTTLADVDSSGITHIESDTSGTYDEPWDLRAARLGLETRLRAAQTSTQGGTSMHHMSTR